MSTMFFATETLLREMLAKHRPNPTKEVDDDYKIFCRLLDLPIPRGLLSSKELYSRSVELLLGPSFHNANHKDQQDPNPQTSNLPFRIFNVLHAISSELYISFNRIKCHIERIPSEILSDIFLYAYEHKFLHDRPITLLFVCRRWREIALQLTALWADLQLTPQTQANPLRLLLIYACHATRLNFSVTLQYLSNLIPHFNHIVSPYFFKRVELSKLQSLRLTGQTAINIIDSFHFQYPQLQELSLINIRHGFPSNIFLGCQNLDDLNLVFNVETFDYILIKKELGKCSISCSDLRIRWDGSYFAEDMYSGILRIRSLRAMIYEYIPGSAPLDQDQFGGVPFNLLSLNPSLTILAFKGIDLGEVTWRAPHNQSILRNLGNVERLTLEESSQCSLFFEDVLNADEYFPKLRCLILKGGDVSHMMLVQFINTRATTVEKHPGNQVFRKLILQDVPLASEEISMMETICQVNDIGLRIWG